MNNTLKLCAIDERFYGDCNGVLIQNEKNSEIRIVKLTKENQTKFNRNDEKDLLKLWNLYETSPKEFTLNN